jgi:hypothetical protein
VLLVNVQRNELLHGDYLTSRGYATLSPFYQAHASSSRTDHGGGRWCAIAAQLRRDRGTTDC